MRRNPIAPFPASLPRRRLLQAGMLFGLGSTLARASTFPERPVRIILPQPPGGAADRLARIFGERLEARWKQSVVVENRPGGGVVIGTLATARAPADGYTFALLGSSLSINAVQRTDLPYDALKDLQPLARIGYHTMALVAAASFPANTIAELIALAKKQPGQIAYGSNGIGTSAQLAGDMLCHMADVKMQHVPYNGAAKLYTDIIGGQLPIGFSVASSAESFIKAGQLKVLGVTSTQRSPLYPQWPTIAETLPGFEAVNWAGFAGPAQLPEAVTQRIAQDILAIAADPAVGKALAAMGIEVSTQEPGEFSSFIRSEIARFAAVTRPLASTEK